MIIYTTICLVILNVLLVLVLVVVSFVFLTRKYRREKEESRIVMDLVEKIISEEAPAAHVDVYYH